ncbi:YceD family protein [Ruegeria arenilitoris]|uniref:YceD family protein n=1 Tax=Ruegeria arenilitoris TaxID=1173585 RepID=UPI001481A9CD|nr:DUF177 domain-containing protein [Ruegeria arenilitoris]
MTETNPLRVADLPQNAPTPFELRPGTTELERLKRDLDLLGLRKLSFVGNVRTQGKRDWVLNAKLGATVTQPCVVTLEPVTTRIETPVHRVFLAEWDEPDEPEFEMPEDDDTEALGPYIDLATVMAEALSLALPQYPRKKDAALGQSSFTEPGKQVMSDEEVKPFAGLASLRDALKKDE